MRIGQLNFTVESVFIFLLLQAITGCKSEGNYTQQFLTQQADKDTSTWMAADPQFYRRSLSKGVNLSNWFSSYIDNDYFLHRFTDVHLKQVHELGFRHVRLPLAWGVLFNEDNPTVLNAAYVASVDKALKLITDAGLAVILDPLHGASEETEKRFATDPAFQVKVSVFWQSVIKRYRYQYTPDQLFFEVMSEPHAVAGKVVSADWWPAVQELLVSAIRKNDSHHYVIVGGGDWNKIGGLLKVRPYAFGKLIYNFHFYDQMEFTHQGAPWAGPYFEQMARVPYPSSPMLVDSLWRVTSNPEFKSFLADYGVARWNGLKIDSIMRRVSQWAVDNKIDYVTCNEFGVYKVVAPVSGRLAWLRDTRIAMERYGFGWTMWEYDEGFGLVEYPSGSRGVPVVDQAVRGALGL